MCYVPLYVEYSKSHFKTLLLRCDVVSHGLLVMIMKVLKRTKLEQYWGVLKFWNTTTNIHVKQSWLLNIQMKTKYSGIDLFKLKYTKKQGIGSPHQVSSLVRGVLTTWQSEMNVVCMDIANRSTKAPVGCLSFGNKSAPAQHFVNPFLIPPLDSCSCRTLWKGVHDTVGCQYKTLVMVGMLRYSEHISKFCMKAEIGNFVNSLLLPIVLGSGRVHLAKIHFEKIQFGKMVIEIWKLSENIPFPVYLASSTKL